MRKSRLDLTISVVTQSRDHGVKKLKSDFSGFEAFGSGAGDDHDISARRRDLLLVASEPFPQAALDPVSANGVKKAFLDHESQPMVSHIVERHIDAEMCRAKSPGGSLDSLVVLGATEPLSRAKPEFFSRSATLLYAVPRRLLGHLDG